MSIKLRPYQQAMVDQTRDMLRHGVRRVLIQGATGMGKTALTAHMIGTARARGKRAWFVVHRRELVKQSALAFQKSDIPYGVMSAGFRAKLLEPVQVCAIQTLIRRVRLLPSPDMIVWDEAHHCTSRTWSMLQKMFADAIHIGLSATPQRLDGRGLIDHFDEIVLGPEVRWLIDQGYLSDYRYICPESVVPDRLTNLNTQMGDYKKDQLAGVMDNPSITGDAVKNYLRFAKGKRAVAFAVNRDHSRHIAEQFRSAGVPAEHVDGSTPIDVRDAAIERFAQGRTLVLSNVDLFGEGFDLPAIEAAILLRPTQSLTVHLQQIGRALRPYPGKTHAIIIDHVDNLTRHWLPDTPRQWSLESKARGRGQSKSPKVAVRICPKCYHAMPGRPGRCTNCGHLFETQAREVATVEGELKELTPEQLARLRANREQGQARTLEDLEKIGQQRGYKDPARWAEHILEGRRRAKLKRQAETATKGARLYA